MPAPIAYSIEDYAKLLGVGRSTLYAMIADGLIVARKLGTKSIRIFHEDNIGFRDRCPVATLAPTLAYRNRPDRRAAA